MGLNHRGRRDARCVAGCRGRGAGRRALGGGIFIVFVVGALRARAAAPVVDYLFPAGGQRGTSVQVTAGGKFESWPVQGWVDSPGLHVSAAKESGVVTVQIDKDAPLGPHLL